MNLRFRKATFQDEAQTLSLVNSVYRSRGERQWTSEVDLVDGPRINSKTFGECVDGDGSVLLLAFNDETLVGCVHLKNLKNKVNLGMLSISGAHQQYGIGAKLLAFAEKYALESFRIPVIEMQVISVRSELMHWYHRKGYTETGQLLTFDSLAASQNTEKGQKLYFKVLRKNLHSPSI